MKEFDAIVIGAGSGLDIASAYASQGQEVAVIEPGPMGGTCLNRGCIPSKMLIHHAEIIETVKGSEKFDIDAEVKEFDFKNIVRKVNEEVSTDAENIEKAIRDSDNHTLYKKEAEFVEDKVLKVGEEKITSEKIFIAAGTRPLVPPVNGLSHTDFLTSREALQIDEAPEDMVVIGGGYIAMELSGFFNAFGVDVTVLEMADKLVGREDHEISEKFTELAKQKFDVNLGLKAVKVEEVGGKKKVVTEDKEGNKHSFAGEELFVAAGRVPNTDNLKLEENTSIELTERGFIETDEFLRTNVEGVYAIGDIAGNYMFKHSANLEAEVATKHSFGHEEPVNYDAMPHAIFSMPQVAGVGKTEQQLEEEGVSYRKSRYNYNKTGMGMAMKEEDGFVKVMASEDGEILGCHILGPQASTLIHEVILAMRNGLKVKDIQDTIHVHPALSEVVARAFNQL